MNSSDETPAVDSRPTSPPFLYEIRVKGRLSSEQWTSWFDDLAVSTDPGATTLRGRVPDHAALYGLLARLRDLAIPLISVKVLDAEAQVKLRQLSRRYDLLINALLVAVYLLLLGGLAAITVFVAPIINVALALALLFAALGGLAHAFWLWSGRLPWRWLAYGAWAAAAITFVIYIPVSRVLPPAFGIALMFLVLAGGMVYLIYYLRRRAEAIQDSLPGDAPAASAAEPAGADSGEPTHSDAAPGG